MRSKINEMVGKQYGYLKVIEITEDRKCLCECACGEIKKINPYNIRNGKSKSCGCFNRKKSQEKRKNLENKVFGELKVISYAGHKKDRVAWNCLCSCGNTCVVTAHELTQGKIKSCGCLKKKNQFYRDIEGKVINELKVIEKTNERDYKGSIIWLCKCRACGSLVKLSEDALLHGNYKSCGCLKINNGKRLQDSLHFYEGTCLEFVNRRKRKDNSSGAVGVYKIKEDRYRASITFKGKKYNLGCYKTFQEAVAARNLAEQQLFEKFTEHYKKWLNDAREAAETKPFYFKVTKIGNQFFVETQEDGI